MENEKIIQICSVKDYVELNKLIPFSENPNYQITKNKLAFERLKQSIINIGLFKPFLVYGNDGNKIKKNTILAGNQRYQVIKYLCKKEGYRTIGNILPVIYQYCDETIAGIIALRDNIREVDTDPVALGKFLKTIEQSLLDIELTGISRYEAQQLIESSEKDLESLSGLNDIFSEIPTKSPDVKQLKSNTTVNANPIEKRLNNQNKQEFESNNQEPEKEKPNYSDYVRISTVLKELNINEIPIKIAKEFQSKLEQIIREKKLDDNRQFLALHYLNVTEE